MAGNLGQPIVILSDDVERSSGSDALDRNIAAAKAVGETVRSTLGPISLDKMIVDSRGDVVVTNDGSTVLQTVEVESPAARMMVEVAQTMKVAVGDGTTSAAVFAGELLSCARDLLDQGIHSANIVKGYHLAARKAVDLLESLSEPIGSGDDDLRKVALTGMNSKGSATVRELLADVCVKAVRRVEKDGVVDVDTDVHILNADGVSVEDTHLVDGVAIFSKRADEDMPRRLEDARIALVDDVEPKELGTKMGTLNIGPKLKFEINSSEKLQEFSDAKKKPLFDIIDRVSELGVNVVLCKKGLTEEVVYEFAKRGVFAVKIASEEEVKVVGRATGARLIPHAERLTEDDLGHAGLVEERGEKDKEIVYFEQCKNPNTVSIVTTGRADTSNMGDTIVGALHVLKDVMEDDGVVPGGGAIEVELAGKIREYAPSISGREHLAVQVFADALESIPRAIAQNAGLDELDLLITLRAEHKAGHSKAGIDVTGDGVVENITDHGVIDPVKVKKQSIKSGVETANMLLRIDDVIASKIVAPPSEDVKAPGDLGPDEGYYNTCSPPKPPRRLDY